MKGDEPVTWKQLSIIGWIMIIAAGSTVLYFEYFV